MDPSGMRDSIRSKVSLTEDKSLRGNQSVTKQAQQAFDRTPIMR
jgi:hypothetical protein